MLKKSPEEFIEEWRQRDRKNIERSAVSMIPHVIGKAAVALVSQDKPITTENLIQHLEGEIQNSGAAESWYRTALKFLEDSASRQ
ncbi:hypothetical protein ACU6Q5_06160 [Enterobacter sp. CCM 8629]|jgi:hypothetical protein